MKIAIVGTELAALDESAGALEKLSVGWARQLYALGLDVYLYSHEIAISPPPVGIELFTFSDVSQLTDMFRHSGIDIAIFNNRPLWPAEGLAGRINIFHNYDDAWGLPTPLDKQFVMRSLKDSRNLAVSQALVSDIIRKFPQVNVDVLYPFINDAFLTNDDWHDPGKNDHKHIKILFPNRTLEKKGLRWIIDTIDNYLCSQVSLTVVHNISPWKQETSEHKELIALANSKPYVELERRRQTTNELIDLYLAHDVVVTPSTKEEGFGLIPLEAQALGIPVVASNLGGLKESVIPPNRLVPLSSQSELAEAIYEASSISEQDKNAVASYVKDKFSPASSAINLKSEIEQLFHRNSLS